MRTILIIILTFLIMSTNNPLESARTQMTTAYAFLRGQYDAQFPKLLSPERVIEVSIPVEMDSGEIRLFSGYRSQHNAAR